MRHADLAMTGRYTHLSPAARESAVRLLDGPSVGEPRDAPGGKSSALTASMAVPDEPDLLGLPAS